MILGVKLLALPVVDLTIDKVAEEGWNMTLVVDPTVEKIVEEGGNMTLEEESTGTAAKRKRYVAMSANIRKLSCMVLSFVISSLELNFAE
jgi:hypothetical protein